MRRTSLFASLAVGSVALMLATGASAPPPPCTNHFVHEPLLVYEISGYTLGGYVDLQLTAYSDGWLRANHATADGTQSIAQVAAVSPSEVQTLIADLLQLGAGVACDRPDLTSDVPLSTLTVLRGATDARSHTWSWLEDDGQGGAINMRLAQFVQTAFPGF